MSELNEETSNSSENVSEETTVVDETGDQNNTSDSGSQGGEGEVKADAENEKPQDEPEFIEQNGKKLVPYERMVALNERMKKAEEATAFVETLRTDPEARKQFLEDLGLEKNSPAQTPVAPTVDPVTKFISEYVREEDRSHYEGLVGALEQRFDAKYEAALQKALIPYRSFIGETVLASVKAKAPDFDKYAMGITKRMAANPHLSAEDAYKLESYNDRFNAGKKTALKTVEQHKTNLNKAPLNKNPQSNSSSTAKKAGDLKEAFNRAWDKTQGA